MILPVSSPSVHAGCRRRSYFGVCGSGLSSRNGKRGLSSTAIPLLQECVAKSPGHTAYHYHLGMAFLADGEKAEGREQLEAALKMGLSGDDAQQARKALAQPN